MGYLITFLVFAFVIFVHELGHFIVMRRNGVRVHEFSIGFGPRLASFEGRDGVTYSWRLIPLGGFVRPEGEGPEGMGEAAPWARIKIALAGPMMNCAVASVCAVAVLYAGGEQSPVMQSPVVSWIPYAIRPIVVGVTASFLLSFATPLLVAYLAATNFTTFFTGMVGPIGIFQMGGSMGGGSLPADAAEPTALMAFVSAMLFMWLLNVGIAGFNLMPMFPLDGGHVVTAILERLGLKRDSEVIAWYRRVTFALTLGLIFMVFAADFMRLFGLIPSPF
ncbi:site-2 protease family protein [Patescibacteria group bacterium]